MTNSFLSPPPPPYWAISRLSSSRTSMTSSSSSWICAVTTSGFTGGSAITAWRTSSVWVPLRLDHSASASPFVSRQLGARVAAPFVVTPPHRT